MYKPIKPDDLPKSRVREIPMVKEDLEDFMETGFAAAEVTIPDGCKPKSVYAAYTNRIKKLGLPVKMIMRDGRVYMVKTGKGVRL